MALCACGCGVDAGLYKSSFSAQSIVAGEPKSYLKGHGTKGKHASTCIHGHALVPDNLNTDGKCIACHKVRSNEYFQNHKQEINDRNREEYSRIRKEVLDHYGHRCACCGESAAEFLALDHIKGGGNKHRRTIKCKSVTVWVYNNHYPEGFRLLCHNCNFALGAYGYCPHKEIQ